MSGGAPSKLLQFLAAGAIVAVSSWDVHRKIRANSVPVTAEQWEDIKDAIIGWRTVELAEPLQTMGFEKDQCMQAVSACSDGKPEVMTKYVQPIVAHRCCLY